MDILGEDLKFVYINCPLEVCEERDVKGIYAKARAGEINNFTGIDAPFEEPKNPFLSIKTHELSEEEALNQLLDAVLKLSPSSTKFRIDCKEEPLC